MKKYKPHVPRIPFPSGRVIRLVMDSGVLTIHWRATSSIEPAPRREEQWITETDVELRTSLSADFLRQERFKNTGPEYLRRGHAILYKLSNVRDWISKRTAK